jgi:hypothetical protein
MITIQDLVKSGYQKFDDSLKKESKPYYRGTYQLCVRDEIGKKYFINIEHWNFPSAGIDQDSFHAHCQFNSHSTNSPTFDASLFVSNLEIKQVEAWYENLWLKLEVEYYEKEE